VKHDYYALSYNETYEQAEWVTYYLKANEEVINHFKRPRFIEDPKVITKSANSDNYKNQDMIEDIYVQLLI